MKKLKLGFIVDDILVPNHMYEFINSIIEEHEFFQKPTLIIQRINKVNKKKSIFKTTGDFLLRLLTRLEIFAVRRKHGFEDYRVKKSLNLNLFNVIEVTPNISDSGFVYTYSEDCLDKVINEHLDTLIRCGSGILRGEILKITKFGILSLHHGDNRKYRGGPPGFWEVLHNQDSSGFIIQKLTDELDGGKIILRGNIQTKSFWHLNTATLFRKANPFLLKILKKLASDGKLEFLNESYIYDGIIYKNPNILTTFKYIVSIYTPLLFSFLSRKIPFLKRRDVWEVSYGRFHDKKINLFKSNTIKNPQNRFLADPFIYKKDKKNICFVEDYSFIDKKGRISAIELIDEDNYNFLDVVLEEDFHLSFPYIFTDNENIYMVPESSENNDIRIYECIEFPNKWNLKKIIMNNISAVDSVIFKQNNVWYLLTNICSAEINDHSSELHLFSSSDFLNKDFEPSKLNPVIFNSKYARNGGLFVKDNEIYRTAQFQGKSHYGKSLSINKIQMISEDEYIEKKMIGIQPNFKNQIISTHHFHSNESFYTIDHLKKEKVSEKRK